MRLEGQTTDEICSALEIKRRTLYLWFSDPLVKTELQAQLERINQLFAEKLAETAVQGLTALAEVATAPVNEPLDWRTKLEAIRLIVERAIPPGVFPDPELPEDPAKAILYKVIREFSSDQLEELGRGAQEKLARLEAAGAVNGSARYGGHER
jgi:hypothetical protein